VGHQWLTRRWTQSRYDIQYTFGQVCSATSRLLLQESIAGKILPRLIEETKKIQIANPNLKENKVKSGLLGPLVSKGQWDRVNSYIQGAIAEGAKLLTGGKKPDSFKDGYFLEPTVLSVTPNMKIWQEEVFGPVLSLMTFKDEKEAITLANDSDYGLAGAVFSKDATRCQRVSKKLRVGVCWINCSQPTFVEAPWGGLKKSGIGRELGPWGLENYLEPKQVTQYIVDDDWGWYMKPRPKNN